MKEPAHLPRGVFYVLLLLAVCAIPFALAQRNTFKQVNRATQSKMATKFAGARRASGVAQATKLSGVHSKAPQGGCIVVNGDFEAGDLPPWYRRNRIQVSLAIFCDDVAAGIGSTPEIPRLPVSTPASSTQEPSHYSPVR